MDDNETFSDSNSNHSNEEINQHSQANGQQELLPQHPDAEHPPLTITDPSHPLYDSHGYLYISNYPSTFVKSKIKGIIHDKLGVQPIAHEKIFRKKGLYLMFESPEEATAAKKKILSRNKNYVIDFRKPKKWDAKHRLREQERAEKRMKFASTLERDIEDQVTPLAKLQYVDQLKKKQEEVIKTMEKHLGYTFLENWINYESMPSYLESYIKRIAPAMIETRGAQFRVTKEIRNRASEQFKQQVEKSIQEIIDLDKSNSCSHEERVSILEDACSKSLLLPYKFLPIVSSPQVYGYRNNCEFTCGINKDNEKAVGFLSGLYSQGFTGVESPANLKHIPQSFVSICERMETLVRKSPLACYSKTNHQGFWRMIKVRGNRAHEFIIMIQVNSTNFSSQELNDAKNLIIEGFTDAAFQRENNITIKGILFQEYDGVSNAAPEDCPLELIFGEENIYEEILGKKFRISMKSFFQVNTLGAELLYSIAIEWAREHCEDALLLDVCCGTGTIGIIMSKHVEQVVGLEINADAVEDAKRNAELNQVINVEYVLGKAEDTIADVVEKYKHFKNIVAIVDPPRAGLHKTVLKTLRSTPEIEWLVYVSCGPGSLAEDVKFLCNVPNKKLRKQSGDISPFYPIQQVPVDMFPHTKHCENVMLLRRWNGEMVDTAPYKFFSKKGWQIDSEIEDNIKESISNFEIKTENEELQSNIKIEESYTSMKIEEDSHYQARQSETTEYEVKQEIKSDEIKEEK